MTLFETTRPPFEVQVHRHLCAWADVALAYGMPANVVELGFDELWLAVYAHWEREAGPRPKGALS